jgi:chlorophyllide a reductase subunit Y
MFEHHPDLVIDTTSLDSFAKEHGIPAIYYIKNISARPIIFTSGAASVLGMIAGLIEKREIYG